MDLIREKIAEYAGKAGIVVAPASEAVVKMDMIESMSTVQFVSMCGVIWLMVERTNKGIFEAKEKGRLALALVSIQWALLWSGFGSVLWMIS